MGEKKHVGTSGLPVAVIAISMVFALFMVIGLGAFAFMSWSKPLTGDVWNQPPGQGLTALAVKFDRLSSSEQNAFYAFLRASAENYAAFMDEAETVRDIRSAEIFSGTFGAGQARVVFALDPRHDLRAVRKEFAAQVAEYCNRNAIDATIEADVVR